jgi:hypothetical protein
MHSVGIPVENSRLHVDDVCRSPVVHHGVRALHTATRLSSTGGGPFSASVHGGCAMLSPVSTAAKTMDETLNSMMENDRNDHPVDCVDGAVPTVIDTALNDIELNDIELIERSAT